MLDRVANHPINDLEAVLDRVQARVEEATPAQVIADWLAIHQLCHSHVDGRDRLRELLTIEGKYVGELLVRFAPAGAVGDAMAICEELEGVPS